MIKNIILIDDKNNLDFYPFNVLHPIYELRIGALKYYQRIKCLFNESEIYYFNHFDTNKQVQNLKLESFTKRNNINNKFILNNLDITLNNVLIINPKFIINQECVNEINSIIKDNPNSNIYFYNQEILLAIFLNSFNKKEPNLIDFSINPKFVNESKTQFKFELSNINVINYLWDTLDLVGQTITNDFKYFESINFNEVNTFNGVFLINLDKIKIGNNVKIEPMVVLNADEGEIIIDDNVKIMSNSVIYGPCYIGKNTTIKTGAKIYPNTAIGEFCKIGGEIENTIFQGYSNKQHEGFLGHSFISEWVNFGADTNNSDLKNTYTNISMQLPHKLVDSGRIFLGLMCGDHTKTGINSMFTTGTISGLCGILVKEWFLPNYIKSFSWGGKHNSPLYKVDKAIETAKIVMKRRNRELLDEEIELLKIEYQRVFNEK